jgi:hypothetical protein
MYSSFAFVRNIKSKRNEIECALENKLKFEIGLGGRIILRYILSKVKVSL